MAVRRPSVASYKSGVALMALSRTMCWRLPRNPSALAGNVARRLRSCRLATTRSSSEAGCPCQHRRADALGSISGW